MNPPVSPLWSRALFQVILLSLFLSVLTLAPPVYWQLEAHSSFGAYYFIWHLIVLPLFLLLRGKIRPRTLSLAVVLNIVLIAWCALILLPFYVPSTQSEFSPQSSVVKVFYANVYVGNGDHAALARMIEEENPDIVALLEMSTEWGRDLALKAKYPYAVEIFKDHPFGLALYSRYPFSGVPVTDLGDDLPPVILSDLLLPDGQLLNFSLVHVIPPLSAPSLKKDRLILRRLATIVRQIDGNLIIAGDLNATPFSETYRKFVDWGELSDAMHGYGLLRTWNADHFFLRLTLDHIFYKGNLGVQHFKRLNAFGSDHLPMLAEFRLNGA